jgi:hypothetical protein
MPKRSRSEDPNEAAFRTVQALTGDNAAPVPRKKRKNPAAVALGRKGGKKGGPARAARMTPEARKASAQKAATARWARSREEPA